MRDLFSLRAANIVSSKSNLHRLNCQIVLYNYVENIFKLLYGRVIKTAKCYAVVSQAPLNFGKFENDFNFFSTHPVIFALQTGAKAEKSVNLSYPLVNEFLNHSESQVILATKNNGTHPVFTQKKWLRNFRKAGK